MSPILPAATVVLIRDAGPAPEVLMLRRSRDVSFAKGLWVFPGGKIDREDYRQDLADVEAAARIGAVRETMEETALTIEVDNLLYFAHWTTPPSSPKRYATWFFIAPYIDPRGEGETAAEPVVDGSEILEARWYNPAEAVSDYRAGLLEMMPPTLATLNELSGCDSVEQALTLYREKLARLALPRYALTDRGITLDYRHGDEGESRSQHVLAEPWRFEG